MAFGEVCLIKLGFDGVLKVTLNFSLGGGLEIMDFGFGLRIEN